MATARKTGLGKGLNALFSTSIEDDEVNEKDIKKEAIDIDEKVEGKVLNLKISEVEPNRDQPRKTFNEDSIEELS